MGQAKQRTTITIDEDNHEWIREQPNVSAYINQLVRDDRNRQVAARLASGDKIVNTPVGWDS